MHKIVKEDLENIARSIGDQTQMLSGKTLLLSGGSGFLGLYIVGAIKILNEKVLSKPCRVISIDNYITGSRDNFISNEPDKNITYIETDITNPLSINENVDFIIHAAGIASPVYYQKFPLETIDVAILGTRNLLEYSRSQKNLKSFVLFSSSEIYGDPSQDSIPTPEVYNGNVSSIGPRSCYDESKRLAETICMTYFRKYNTPIKIIRPFNVYGPTMRADDFRVVPNFIIQSLSDKSLTVHDNGNQTRTFCYISDAVVGFLKVLLSQDNGEVYNVGTDVEEMSMTDLAKIVVGLAPKKTEIKLISYPDSYPSDEPRRRKPDISKIKTKLNFKPSVDIKTGLSRTMSWFKDTI